MQVTINSTELLNALNSLKPGVATRSSLPILTHTLIEAKDGRVVLKTTNLEVYLQVTIEGVAITEEGASAVPYKRLIEIVKTLPKKSSISLTQQEKKLLVKGPGRSTTVETMDPEEFPYAPKPLPNTQQVTLATDQLTDMVTRVAPMAADDNSRPVFMGVCTELKDDTLTMATCNAFRLAMQETSLPGAGTWAESILIPAKELALVVKVLPKKTAVTLLADLKPQDNNTTAHVQITAGNVLAVIRLIEGTFPNFRGIIPRETDYKAHVTVATKDMLLAVQAVAPVAKESSNITRLRFQDDTLVVEAKAEDVGEEHQELDITLIGDEMDAIYNNRYLADILKATKSSQITLAMTAPNRPARWAPLTDKQDYQFILMPMSPNR